MSDFAGIIASIDSVVTNITRDPVGTFVAALEPGVYPIRDAALANGLLRPTVDAQNKKIVWHEGATGLTSLVLNTAIVADAAATTFDFGTTNINGIVPDMIISFLGELVRVVSVDYTAGTCEVTRGFGGTTPEADIAVTVVGKIISTSPAETDDAGSALAAYGSASTNYLHYWEEVVKIADTVTGTLSHQSTPEFDVAYQVLDKFKKISREMAHALWLSATNSATATYRTMNSLRSFVVAAGNVASSVGALLFADLDDAVQVCLDAGVVPDTIFAPPALKKGLAQWANSRMKTVLTNDPSAAGGRLDRYVSAPGPELEILGDNSLIATDIFIARRADLHAGFVPILPQVNPSPDLPQMTGLRVERLGRRGAYENIQVLAYGTGQLTNAKGQYLLTGVSSVDSDGV